MTNLKKIPNFIQFHWDATRFIHQYQEGLKNAAKPYGISLLETEILLSLTHCPTCDSITKLCSTIGKTKGVISKACEKLRQTGYISGKIDEGDRRVVHYQLNAASRTVVIAVVRHIETMTEASFFPGENISY
ncbi:MAG TPA: MarR family winged helix-turn-helix transcriptional regulator [Clostridiales bacterium]|nr:MarR family winged helix-turn-helix transcriptional regulator [Clostridiales bacterium]